LAEKLLKDYRNLLPQTLAGGDAGGQMNLGVADKGKITRARRETGLALSDLREALERLWGPLGTSYERYFTPERWKKAVAFLEDHLEDQRNLQKFRKEYDELHEHIKALATKIEEVKKQGYRLAEDFTERVMTAAEVKLKPGTKQEELKKFGSAFKDPLLPPQVGFSRRIQEGIRYQTFPA
jgi:flagellar motility protein MotE (MotC chaperone)